MEEKEIQLLRQLILWKKSAQRQLDYLSGVEIPNIKLSELTLGKIVAVKSAVFTGTQSASVASAGNTAITDLSIAHACEKTTHKVLLLGQVGLLASSTQYANAGVAFAADGTLLNIGAAASSRTRVSASGFMPATATNASMAHFIAFLHAPASVASVTYTLNAINVSTTSSTLYVNRTEVDNDAAGRPRAASVLFVLEVAG